MTNSSAGRLPRLLLAESTTRAPRSTSSTRRAPTPASSATLDLDALETANSHEFNLTSAQRDITTVTGTVKGFFWFVNKHASNAVTIATGYMAYPSGQFTIAADSTALLYWDTSTNKFTAVAKIS